jgi:BspA type Leucine rich repeat region (6 copies)
MYPGGKPELVTIPLSVTNIAEHALACGSITRIILPDHVTSIGEFAFNSCERLTNVALGNGISSIPNALFNYCVSLSSFTVPPSVTSIDFGAFHSCTSLTNVIIPNTVTSIGPNAFWDCTSLISISIPDGVNSIEEALFVGCTNLRSVTIPNSVTNIDGGAFSGCTSLRNITIPDSVLNIGCVAFDSCTNLTEIHFQGNAPMLPPPPSPDGVGGCSVFSGDDSLTVYYLPGTTGWGPTFGERPTALWELPYPVILNLSPGFGVQNNAFFRISWATNVPVVVEASTSMVNPTWFPMSTNTLTDGWAYFSDPDWTNYASRFYRVRGN